MGLYIGCWLGIIHEFYNIYHCLFLEVERTFDILGNLGLLHCSLHFFTEWVYILVVDMVSSMNSTIYITVFFRSRENIWYTRKPGSFSMFSSGGLRPPLHGLYIGCWYSLTRGLYNIYHCLFLEVERTFGYHGNLGLFQCSLPFFTEWVYIFHCSYSLTLPSHARITYSQHSRGRRPRGGNYT